MGIIDEVSKYDLDKMTWHKPEYTQRGRSFALASYPKIMNANDEKIDYIILAQGSRVEDHSKDYMFIKKLK